MNLSIASGERMRSSSSGVASSSVERTNWEEVEGEEGSVVSRVHYEEGDEGKMGGSEGSLSSGLQQRTGASGVAVLSPHTAARPKGREGAAGGMACVGEVREGKGKKCEGEGEGEEGEGEERPEGEREKTSSRR